MLYICTYLELTLPRERDMASLVDNPVHGRHSNKLSNRLYCTVTKAYNIIIVYVAVIT